MKRLEAIDQFRGFAILLMVLANYMNNVASIPPWLKHADDIGYTVIDLIAPMFIFAMGLTYGFSFRRRLAGNGAWITYQHFMTRYLALIGLGFLITLTWEMSGIRPPSINWGLFQALGAAGLITLLVIRLPPLWRFVVGLAMLFGYQVLLDRYWLQEVLGAPHNGPWGALSWGALLILATAMADLYHTERTSRRVYPLVSAGWVVVGMALIQWIPVSKDRVSVSYVLISLGLSSLMFFLFHLGVNEKQWRIPVLTDWGRNPLLLYILSYILLGLFYLIPIPAWYIDAPLWLITIQLIIMMSILSWTGRYLNQHKLYFTL